MSLVATNLLTVETSPLLLPGLGEHKEQSYQVLKTRREDRSASLEDWNILPERPAVLQKLWGNLKTPEAKQPGVPLPNRQGVAVLLLDEL